MTPSPSRPAVHASTRACPPGAVSPRPPAALPPARPPPKVTVLDPGLPRNRFAGHSHGLLGHDHKPPLDILAEARQQLARYPTIKLVNARADSVSGAGGVFSVRAGDGESLGARRLILS